MHKRLLDIKRKTKQITLKIMIRAKEAPIEASKFMGHGLCDHLTKSVSLSMFTNELDVITTNCLTIMRALNVPPQELRGIGIQLTKLDSSDLQDKKKGECVLKDMFARMNKKPNVVPVTATSTTKVDDVSLVKFNKISDKNIVQQLDGRPTIKKSKANIIDMFQEVSTKQQQSLITVKPQEKDINRTDIDPEVYKNLPPDIQQEILSADYLKEMNLVQPLHKSTNTFPTSSRLNNSNMKPNILKAKSSKQGQKKSKSKQQQQSKLLENWCRKATNSQCENNRKNSRIQINYQQTNKESDKRLTTIKEHLKTNILLQKDSLKILLDWVQSSTEPKMFDVQLLGQHAGQLVEEEFYEELYDSINYLGRVISAQRSGSEFCAWHKAFRSVLEAVNQKMSSINQGRELYIPPMQFHCDQCKT